MAGEEAEAGQVVASRRAGPQVQRVRTGGLTKRRLDRFLTELAATCNVTASASAIGVSSRALYLHRRKSSEFARAWEEAICEGYARLEMMLLENALASYAPAGSEEGETTARPKVSEQSALRLLQHHRQQVTAARAADAGRADAGRADGGAGDSRRGASEESEWTSARAELEARLLQMHERLTADE